MARKGREDPEWKKLKRVTSLASRKELRTIYDDETLDEFNKENPSKLLSNILSSITDNGLDLKFNSGTKRWTLQSTADHATDATLVPQNQENTNTESKEESPPYPSQSSVKVSRKREYKCIEDKEDTNIEPPLKKHKAIVEIDDEQKVMRIINIESEYNWSKFTWDFDVTELDVVTKEMDVVMPVLGWHIIKENKWHQEFNVSPKKLICFMIRIQEAYHDNPYHNKYHACDVMCNVMQMVDSFVLCNIIDSYYGFVILLSAIIHDVDHNGYNNGYHITLKSVLAIKYNEQSILENHHLSFAFSILERTELNFDTKMLTELVLRTDMSRHNELLEDIKRLTKLNEFGEKDKIALLGIILHSADIANATKDTGNAVKWAKSCIEEFRNQGDELQNLGYAVDNIFRRDYAIEKSQCNWIKYITPYFEALNELFSKLNNNICDVMIDNLKKNLIFWSEYTEKLEESK